MDVVQAPEVIKATGTGREADYWAVGVLICELLVGVTPFVSESQDAREVAQRIERCEYEMPAKMPRQAADLMKRLLVVSLPALFFGLQKYWDTVLPWLFMPWPEYFRLWVALSGLAHCPFMDDATLLPYA
jgi:serine/threonine protein kinase